MGYIHENSGCKGLEMEKKWLHVVTFIQIVATGGYIHINSGYKGLHIWI